MPLNKRQYWTNLMTCADMHLDLHCPRSAKTIPKEFSSIKFAINESLHDKIAALSKNNKICIENIILTVWNILLNRYTEHDNFTLVYCPTPTNLKNTFPLIVSISENESFSSLVEKISRQCTESKKQIKNYPLSKILALCQKLGLIKNPRYLNVCVNVPIDFLLGENHNTEIAFSFKHKKNIITCQIDYNIHLFEKDFIERIPGHFETLFHNCLDEPEKNIKLHNILTRSEYQTIVYDWNQTEAPYPKDKTLYQLFEEQVEKTPNNIAAICEDKQLSYQELNEKANQLAHTIKTEFTIYWGEELKPDTLIGIYIERSLEMIICILAILKAGGAYVPFDRADPEKRLSYKIQDSSCKMILTSSNQVEPLLSIIGTDTLVMNLNACEKRIVQAPKHNLKPISKSTNLAYVIYTSGSTGQPNGVMIEHKSVVNLSCDQAELLKLASISPKNCLQYASILFDASVFEIFCTLFYGHKLCIASESQADKTNNLINLFINRKIQIATLTPSLLKSLKIPLQYLETLIVAGETPEKKTLDKFSNHNIQIINGYGPTESTVCSTWQKYNQTISSVIGKPLSNIKCYLLSSRFQPLPIGFPGELYIGGDGLARGYLNKPELTARRFIQNPFAIEKDKKLNRNLRLYKTGDMVKWLPDGSLEFLGRNDNQIKINGIRIELGEIEAKLSEHPYITSCVAVVHQRKNIKYIAAYYTAKDKVTASELRSYLSGQIPDYMLPSSFTELKKIPLTVSGKIDRLALPIPNINRSLSENYIAPKSQLEKLISVIWNNVLGLKKIGLHDNFFHLGGNSILATNVLQLILKRTNLQLPFSSIYNNPTIKQLCQYISDSNQKKEKIIIKRRRDLRNKYKPFGLTDVQYAYWFGRGKDLELGNISTHIYSEFDFKELNVKRLEISLNKLITRHDMLKTIFLETGQQQFLKDIPYYNIKFQDLSKLRPDNREKKLQEWRNELSHQILGPHWPLFDIRISKLSDRYRLHISLDILVFDASSVAIFFSEWNRLYKNINSSLPPINFSFRDYVLGFEKLKKSDSYKKDKKYWMNKIPNLPFGPELPLAKQALLTKTPRFVRKHQTLDKNSWDTIKEKANKHKITPTSILLTAFGVILAKWSKNSRFLINLTIYNRLPFHDDVDKIIGDFTLLELLEFDGSSLPQNKNNFNHTAQQLQSLLWDNLDHKLFSSIEVIRELLKFHGRKSADIIAPVVFTSFLNQNMDVHNQFIPEHFLSINYEITQTPQVWLDYQCFETSEGLVIHWDYVEELFHPDMISDMYNAYYQFLIFLSNNDWENIAGYDLLPKHQKDMIKSINSDTQKIPEILMHEAFIKQANKTPNNIAVISHKKILSYKALNEYSAKIANALQSIKKTSGEIIDINPKANSPQFGASLEELNLYPSRPPELPAQGGLIGILMKKGWEQVAACLGILRSGNAYLPINLDWPTERINLVLGQGNVKTILSQRELLSELQTGGFNKDNNFLCLCVDEEQTWNKYSTEYIDTKQNMDNTAYVIFTSGSTGTPKGVVISHRSAMNTIIDVNKRFNVKESDKVFALSKLSFDLSVYDIFGLLAAGGTIVIPSEEEYKSPEGWLSWITKENITIWNTVPTLMRMLTEYLCFQKKDILVQAKEKLRLVLLSGDWIPLKLPESIKKLFHNAEIISLGGATEASIWSILYPIKNVNPDWKSIPYGKAMANQKTYILNDLLEFCPTYVTGEIYIAGLGLAKEYFNDPEKTAECFIEHWSPFTHHSSSPPTHHSSPITHHPSLITHHSDAGERLYKTGDIGRLLPDGNIEFLGRKDHQVKIGGHRIELGEIEATIRKLPGIKDAIVTITKDQNQTKHLAAYILKNKEYQDTTLFLNDKIKFKTVHYNIRNDDGLTDKHYRLEYPSLTPTTINRYFYRKSYRQFTKNPINIENLLQCLTPKTNNIDPLNETNFSLEKRIGYLLSELSAYQEKDLLLPKYLYPSAGSLYPVQAYICVNENINSLEKGNYYYHPYNHCLTKLNNPHPIISKGNKVSIHLVSRMNAIEPIYSQMSETFCELEVGYITLLLKNMATQLNLSLQAIDTTDVNLAKSVLGLNTNDKYLTSFNIFDTTNSPDKNDRTMLALFDTCAIIKPHRVNNLEPGIYLWTKNALAQTCKWEPSYETLDQIDATTESILNDAAIILIFSGQKQALSYRMIGEYTQQIMNSCIPLSLGTCPIGYLENVKIPNIRGEILHCLALGNITHAQMTSHEYSQPTINNLNNIKNQLKNLLPSYMIPKHYIELDDSFHFEKINRNILPKVTKENQQEKKHIAPRNEIEKVLHDIWRETLRLDELGINSNFFNLGGDSLSIIKIAAKTKDFFQIKEKDYITRILENPTIEQQAKYLSQQLVVEEIN